MLREIRRTEKSPKWRKVTSSYFWIIWPPSPSQAKYNLSQIKRGTRSDTKLMRPGRGPLSCSCVSVWPLEYVSVDERTVVILITEHLTRFFVMLNITNGCIAVVKYIRNVSYFSSIWLKRISTVYTTSQTSSRTKDYLVPRTYPKKARVFTKVETVVKFRVQLELREIKISPVRWY